MTSLVELQRAFAGAIRGQADELIAAKLRYQQLSPAQVLNIYRHHHQISLRAALGATFKTVQLVIGEEAFTILAKDFLSIHPPAEPCVAEYGASFPEHLAIDTRLRDFAYLADVARLDWAVNCATIARDAPILERDAFAALTAEQFADLRLTAHPSLTLLHSRYPLPEIWRLARSPETRGNVSLSDGQCLLMIWRQNGEPKMAELDEACFRALKRLVDGASLFSVSEDLAESQLAGFFSDQILSGAFGSFRPNGRSDWPGR